LAADRSEGALLLAYPMPTQESGQNHTTTAVSCCESGFHELPDPNAAPRGVSRAGTAGVTLRLAGPRKELCHDPRAEDSIWQLVARGPRTELPIAGRHSDRVRRSQPWVSQVERGTARPTRHEVTALAVAANSDALEGLDIAGFLETPPWARRLEAKLDL
jgi:hypothetical protein